MNIAWDDGALYAYAIAVFLAAGTIKGLAGMGLPTASIGLLTLVIAPRTATALIIFPMLLTNLWQLYRSGDILRACRNYAPFALVLMLGVWLTTRISAQASDTLLFAATGGIIIVFVITNLTLRLPPLPDRFDRAAQIGFGTLGGITGGLTAIWAPPLAIYLLLRHVDRDEFVRVSGLLIFLGSIPLLIGYFQQGHMDGEFAVASALMTIPALLGFAIGERLRRNLSASRFRNILLVMFLIFGMNLLRRAIFGD